MAWLLADVVLAGILVGFAAGASPSPTGGTVATAIVAFLVGAATAAETSVAAAGEIVPWAQLCFVFLISLGASYVITNVLRRQGRLEALGFRGPEKR